MQEKEALFEATAQAFLSGLERVTTSGWGAVMYTITNDKVTATKIKARMD